jgi:hypothetical protein
MIYVLGVFECGCSDDSCLSSVEVVQCIGKYGIKKTIEMMKEHSANFQCKGSGASYIFVFEGNLEEITPLVRKPKPKTIENRELFCYGSYRRAWLKQGKENEKMREELEKTERELLENSCVSEE